MNKATWPNVFAALPDAGFFEVVRHYLGPVSTPFHKPDLIAQMKDFFEREDVTERVLNYIDPEDALFLTFIGFHKQPTEENLTRMISGVRYVALREKLLNLEERLLIWSRNAGKSRYYALTPLGEVIRESGILGPGAVIGEGMAVEISKEKVWLDDSFLNAALAFLNERMPLFRKEGGWRKKSLEILTDRFPILFQDGRGEDRLILAGRALIAAGLAVRKEERLEPRMEAWREIESYSPQNRLAVIKARAAVGRSLPIGIAIEATKLVTECLPEGRAYSREKLASLLQLGTGGISPLSPSGAGRIISHLELMRELSVGSNGLLSRSAGFEPAASINQAPHLSITPVGDITLKPGMPLFCDLALAAEPLKVDVVTTFRMNKDRFLSGLDSGINPDNLFTGLERYSNHPVPSNLRILASEWESDYKTVTMKLGVVFQAKGARRQIIEETGVLNSYAYSRPGDGLWLLDPGEENQWRAALGSIGIDRLPPLLTASGALAPSTGELRDSAPPYLIWNKDSQSSILCTYNWENPGENDISGLLTNLKDAAQSVSLSQEEQEAFHERLDRRIIIVPEQIRKGSWRYEVMSAKGLDYRGKLRLVEAAMSGRDER
ncbi:MAG: hypothetical protein KAH21_13080, partial [Spirochaetaceae bacterium]|nr:hypothetical protein [Spirochaetaceae bacterium]